MSIEQAQEIVKTIFKDATSASFRIRFWDGSEVSLGDAGQPVFTLVFRDADVFAHLVRTQDVYAFLESYVHGRFDIEGDMFAALAIRRSLRDTRPGWWNKFKVIWNLGTAGFHTPEYDKKNVQSHYDISNEVYKRFLDNRFMAYSCAYYHREDESLEDAQEHKLDLICRKLRLKPGETFLDIGCGWGGLMIYAATKYGVKAHGLTLSQNQFDLATQKVRELGLEDQVTIELRDYREFEGMQFDTIASIGMFEHVGKSQFETYFQKCMDLLKPGGLFLNHTITREKIGAFAGEHRFMFTYIFPGAYLDNTGHTMDVMEKVGWEILNMECLRPHYAKTLTEWAKRFIANEEEIKNYIPSEIHRAWKLYLVGLPQAFKDGGISICQTLASKRTGKPAGVPLTMHDVYCGD